MQRIDETGKKYGRLYVDSFAYAKKSGNGTRCIWNCVCDCGNRIQVDGYLMRKGITKSCGCLRSELSSERRQEDLTGQRFTKLLVLKKAYTKNDSVYWECQCDCGKICYVQTRKLKCGDTKSCGCIIKDIMGPKLYRDITGLRSGRLLAIEPTDQRMHRQVLWRCKCDCGGETYVTTTDFLNKHVMSCGCLNSKGEEAIAAYLTSKNIKYKKGYNFKDLYLEDPRRGRLKFDFGMKDNDGNLLCLIEFQGKQHYEKSSNSNFGDLQRRITDQMKKEYCLKNNIVLYEIKYTENIEEKLDEIIRMHVNPVGNAESA